jgi:hypothetical protein
MATNQTALDDFLENFPSMIPPPGVTPNFINPPSKETAIIVLNVIFLALMWSAVAVRLWSKARITHNVGWDDCEKLIPIAS